MDPAEHSSNSARNFFDAASILNSAVFGPASVTFPHLAHMPSAFSMLGHHPGFPLPPFGGLGALNDGLASPLRHSLNPAAGAPHDWWQAVAAAAAVTTPMSEPNSSPCIGQSSFAAGLTTAGNLNGYLSPAASALTNMVVGLDGSLFAADLLPFTSGGDKTSLLHSFGSSPVFNLGSGKSSVSKSTSSGTSTSSSSSIRTSSSNRSSHLSVTSSGSAHSKSKHRSKHSHPQSSTVMTSSINWDPTGILAAQVSRVSSTTTTTTTTTTSSASVSSHSLSFLQGRKATTSTTTTKSTPVLHTHPQTGHRSNSETKRKVVNENSSDSDSQSNSGSASPSYSSNDSSTSFDNSGDDKDKGKILDKNTSPRTSPNLKKSSAIPDHQIDGTKKKLIADQIRQKMRTIMTPLQTPIYKPEKYRPRGKGRPVKSPQAFSTSGMESLDSECGSGNAEEQPLQLVKKPVQPPTREPSPTYKPLNLKTTPTPLPSEVPMKKFENGDDGDDGRISSNGQQNESIAASSNSSSSDSESDSGSDSDSSDGSDSETGSNSFESDDEPLTRDSETSVTSLSTGDKRSADLSGTGSDTPTPVKKRRVIDEKELRIPLEHSWQRQTKIRGIGKRGIVGEVLYHAPCGKKLRTYPDVLKYLEKNGITDLCKENFSFSTKAPIGEFLEMRQGENKYVLLSEHEVFDRYTQVQFNRSRRHKNLDPEAAALKKKRKEQKYEAARQAAELKMQKKMEREKEKEMVKNEKKIKENAYQPVRMENNVAIERKQQKEQEKHFKQQEKIKRQEHLRMERELRAQQVLEEREMKRQQAVMMREQQERERRRQHMLLVKSLEARRRQEERERLKEEKLKEKQIEKERKMNQRRVELQIAAELKKPIEDMEIKDIKEMPDLPRIEGLCLPGKAFADALMVIEFMHNFGKALGIPEEVTPSLNDLQNYLMGDTKEDSDKYIIFTSKLLKIALSDPGVPNPKEATTKLGQKIVDIELNKNVISEVLRIFVIARNGGSCQISDWLSEKPLKAFNPTQKSSVLEFLCNELLCGRLLTNEIERTIEGMSNLRRDKWIVEGKLRRLRIIQAKKYNRPSPKISLQGGSSPLLDEDSHATNVSGSKQGSDDEDDSGNDSDITTVTNVGVISEGEEDDPTNAEDCEKKIEKLQRQHSQYRDKVFESSYKLRAVSFGQDRYKRRYWLLPYCGRLVLEGLESGAMDSEDEEDSDDDDEEDEENGNDADNDDDDDEEDGEEESENKSSTENEEDIKDSIKKEVKSEGEDEETEMEPVANSTPVKQEPSKQKNGKPEPAESTSPIIKEESPTNLFLQKPETTKFSDLIHISKSEGPSSPNRKSPTVHNSHSITSHTPSSSSSVNSPPIKNSSTTNSDTKSGFISIDSILKKDYEPNSQTLPFLPSMASYPVPPLFADQLLKATEINEQKPWFSILPRMPCDETSLTRSPLNISHRMLNNSPFLFPHPLPFHAFPVRSPTFASFQMGQIQGSPVDLNLSPLANNTNTSNSFFKVPPLPLEISSSRSSTPSASLTNTLNNTTNSTSFTSNGSTSMDLMLDADPEGLLKSLQGELKPIPKAMRTGWWHLADIEHLKGVLKCLHPRGIRERNLQKSLQKYFDLVCQACTKDVKDVFKLKEREEFRFVSTTGAPQPDNDSNLMSAVAHQVENEILEEIMKLEERVYSASLQVKIRDRHDDQQAKGSRLPQKLASESSVNLKEKPATGKNEKSQSLFENARERLVKLEKNIERRYLKPPLCKNIQINLANITLPGDNHSNSHDNGKDDDEDIPPGLLTWRNAVQSSLSAAQLTLCANLLTNSIAWEKSIMKVLCQICRKDDNEAELLLCDGCDKGYHTYCFKPKLEKIPDGDWYCYECISKATGVPCCVVCGKKNGKLALCDECPRAFHIDCLIPPLQRLPKKWLCASCVAEKGNKKSKRGRKKKEETLKKEKKSSENHKSEEEKKKEQYAKDMSLCKVILLELEKNDNGWPFLQPVNQKQFPSYKKYIKKPMDFYTMRLKLRDNQYKSKEQFAADVQLIFDNCEIFNEDDSEVGKAGHKLRQFFLKRWTEQINQRGNNSDDTPPQAPSSSSSSTVSKGGGGGDNDSAEES